MLISTRTLTSGARRRDWTRPSREETAKASEGETTMGVNPLSPEKGRAGFSGRALEMDVAGFVLFLSSLPSPTTNSLHNLFTSHSFYTTMAHRRTYSQRRLEPLDMDKLSLHSPPVTPALAVFNSFHHSTSSASKPKQYWQRTTFLALLALMLISCYVILVAQPSLAPIAAHGHHSSESSFGLAAQKLARLSSEAYRMAAQRKQASSSSTSSNPGTASEAALPQLQLTPEQELAAITTFLALPQNVLPTHVDPSRPIDPQLVLDFNTRSPQAIQEVDQLVADTWARYPVVLFSKVRAPRRSQIYL